MTSCSLHHWDRPPVHYRTVGVERAPSVCATPRFISTLHTPNMSAIIFPHISKYLVQINPFYNLSLPFRSLVHQIFIRSHGLRPWTPCLHSTWCLSDSTWQTNKTICSLVQMNIPKFSPFVSIRVLTLTMHNSNTAENTFIKFSIRGLQTCPSLLLTSCQTFKTIKSPVSIYLP